MLAIGLFLLGCYGLVRYTFSIPKRTAREEREFAEYKKFKKEMEDIVAGPMKTDGFIHNESYLDQTVTCKYCGTEYNPKRDHKRGRWVKPQPFYVNNFCSRDCVKDMDKVTREFK